VRGHTAEDGSGKWSLGKVTGEHQALSKEKITKKKKKKNEWKRISWSLTKTFSSSEKRHPVSCPIFLSNLTNRQPLPVVVLDYRYLTISILDYRYFYILYSILAVRSFCGNYKPNMLSSAVQFTFGWSCKHSNRDAVVRYISKAFNIPQSEDCRENQFRSHLEVWNVVSGIQTLPSKWSVG
jgi:hypothetical protein